MRRLTRIVVVYLGLSAALGLAWLVSSYPDHPSTPAQWAGLFLLALPLQLAGELVGHGLWNNRRARAVDESTSGKSLSLLRICYGLVALLLVFGLAAALMYGWGQL